MSKKIKAIELFSGNGDITSYLRSHGIECISVDYDASKHPSICADVYALSDDFLRQFDFIWLSPDCTTYSVASRLIHRNKGGAPHSDYARFCDDSNSRFISRLIDLKIPFIIENPRGHFRNMPFVNGLYRVTVYYSTYGASYEKPTDLFSNCHDLLLFFDTSYLKASEMLHDRRNFLERCKMPIRLIEDIYCACLDSKEVHQDCFIPISLL